MTWGGFGINGTTPLVTTSSRMNSEAYQGILQNNLLPYGTSLAGRGWVFQHDNAPIHRSNSTAAWIQRKNVRVMDWPARSPDLNPMENLWGDMARRVYRRGTQYNNVQELESAVQREWRNTPQERLAALNHSMPNRMFEVIRNQGCATKY